MIKITRYIVFLDFYHLFNCFFMLKQTIKFINLTNKITKIVYIIRIIHIIPF
jgi:hypothetical protein